MKDRNIAGVVLTAFAESDRPSFAPLGFYDDDAEILNDIGQALNMPPGPKLQRAVFRTCNQLVRSGVLTGKMQRTSKEYIDEPAKQKEFMWANPGYAARLHSPPRRYVHSILGPEDGPKFELERFLDRTYGSE